MVIFASDHWTEQPRTSWPPTVSYWSGSTILPWVRHAWKVSIGQGMPFSYVIQLWALCAQLDRLIQSCTFLIVIFPFKTWLLSFEQLSHVHGKLNLKCWPSALYLLKTHPILIAIAVINCLVPPIFVFFLIDSIVHCLFY